MTPLFTLYDSNANTSKDQRVDFSGQCNKANKSMGVISGLGMFMRNNPELAEKDVSGFVKPLDQKVLFFPVFLCVFTFSAISLCAKVETGFIFGQGKVTHLIHLP